MCGFDADWTKIFGRTGPWKKYYDEAAFSAVMPNCSIYEMVYENNKDRLKEVAIEYFKTRVTYGQLFDNIQKTRDAFIKLGVKRDDVVTLLLPNIPESVYCVYALSRIGAIANMVDLRLAGQKLADYINSVHSDVVVCSDVFAHNIAEIQDLVQVKHFIVLTPFDSMAAPVRTVLKMKNKRPAVKEIRNRLSWTDFLSNVPAVPCLQYDFYGSYAACTQNDGCDAADCPYVRVCGHYYEV